MDHPGGGRTGTTIYTDDFTVAVHEAAHCILAKIHGVGVDQIDLIQIGNQQGMATIRWSEADWEADFQITLAGTMAEGIFADDVREHGQSDMARLERLLREADEDPENWSPRVVALADETMDLVIQHWAAIQRVARELLARGRLSEHQINEAMGSAP